MNSVFITASVYSILRKAVLLLGLVGTLSLYVLSQSPSHSATLKWTGQKEKEIRANPKTRIEKYFVFRADAQRGSDSTITCGSDFEKIAEVDAPATTYADKTVQANHAYCYYVKAYRAGLLSRPSAPARALIPADK